MRQCRESLALRLPKTRRRRRKRSTLVSLPARHATQLPSYSLLCQASTLLCASRAILELLKTVSRWLPRAQPSARETAALPFCSMFCHMATWSCIYLERVRLLCPVQGSMLSVFCRGAEDRADDEQEVAQETGPKPVLPVEKMLSKKVGPIPLVSVLSDSKAACVPELAPGKYFRSQAAID